jgi:organic hydroperoxide reductase OsmC/OhrA
MAERKDHLYPVTANWRGSTGDGYEEYTRTHEASAPPARASVKLSSDPTFRGDPALLNPEQLLVMAVSSCQMLTFLALSAKRRLNVVEYEDRAEGFMPDADKPVRITRILLKPRIVIDGAGDPGTVESLVKLAHSHCFIANSVKSDIRIEPEIVILKL